ncbi:MAG: TIGR04282 family arsenosugar biosynthesis glycosyltransferase [Methylococcales bacterium]|nr:TIGR04282 family arsenosugar biosynthesis glycosyltransferase [Methylococcales bacterium]
MAYKYPDAVLMVFCKAPVAGQVKTRLYTEISPEAAAQLQMELANNLLQWAAASQLCPVQLWCSPSDKHEFFSRCAEAYPITLQVQQGADLGERMHHAFCQALGRYPKAILIGCDCPSLNKADLEEALTHLNPQTDCVLAPAEDGGYVLIGLKQAHPELFDNMPWGSAEIAALTRSRIKRYNLSHHELKQQWDLDTPQDLRRYQAFIQGQQGKV